MILIAMLGEPTGPQRSLASRSLFCSFISSRFLNFRFLNCRSGISHVVFCAVGYAWGRSTFFGGWAAKGKAAQTNDANLFAQKKKCTKPV